MFTKDDYALVGSIIKNKFSQYIRMGLYPDLFNAGVLGLLEAKKRFKKSHHVKFSTYAYYWIRECIRRAVSSGYSTRDIPSGRPTDLCIFCDANKEGIQRPEVQIYKKVLELSVLDMLTCVDLECSDRNLRILKERFGLEGESDSLHIIANKYHISSARANQIVNELLEVIRRKIVLR